MGVRLEDLDREEILRTRATAIEQRRLSAGTSMDVGDILERLGLRIDGQVTQAAQMLYGTKFLPEYPQALLKLGRFRGTKITGDILDNKQEYLHAFGMVREAIAWLDRTLPLSARFPKGAIEVWGRGTNRVVEACRAYGLAAPTFTEASGAITVTFKAEIVPDLGRAPSQVSPKSVLSVAQVQVLEIASVARSLPELMAPSGLKNKTRFRDQVVAPLLDAGQLEMTIPDKPRSSKQQYRITEAGRVALLGARRE